MIAIEAGKPKGGITECLKVDPDKVRRLSLSEEQLEKASEKYAKQIVRYSLKILFLFIKNKISAIEIQTMFSQEYIFSFQVS